MSDDLASGQVLADRFEIVSLVGRGGMSSVYEARDRVLGRTVAIKVFTIETAEDRVRLESEVRLLSQLNNPHLVTVHDAYLAEPADDFPSYLVMEFVAGNTLREFMSDARPSDQEIATIVSDIGSALSVVHAAGIVHRDVKPANILLERVSQTGQQQRAKLADFGIAHTIGATRLTAAGTVIGTVGYLSPEQVEGSTLTSATDIYSLGLVALEALTGRPEFPGTVAESLAARLSREPSIPPTLSDEWRRLLGGMLQRDPSARPTATEVALAARTLATEDSDTEANMGDAPTLRMPAELIVPSSAAQTELLTDAAPTPPGKEPRVRAPVRRRPVVIALIIVVALVLILVLGMIAIFAVQSQLSQSKAPPAVTSSTSPTSILTPTPTPTLTVLPGKGKGHGKGHGKNG